MSGAEQTAPHERDGDDSKQMEEGEAGGDEPHDTATQKKGPTTKKKAQNSADHCLSCGTKCKKGQASLFCTLCAIWCHKECAQISEAVFKSLRLQKKEMGMAYWACRSCLSFAQKVNTQFRGVAEKIGEVENRTVQNSYRIIKIQKSVDELERRMQRMERRMEEERQDIEDILYEELRER